ncbi:hypothetical protein L249_7118 [Ophiocordyceps polyrhachis-furcata BCC 54312]|uniref:Uncharacterized protein n=1 Tax=Ophiocordyceps polyrhachis-furcata BCC 54312 TaxID=1330021 RepID=A0A367LKZ2_9HYPO|nr:hypothetical protein L249_7118 [Ophiocordyceps polyrhachis-furcata BCC 54312]
MTAISTARRSMYSAPIAVTIAVTSRSGAMTAIAPLGLTGLFLIRSR